MDYTPDIASVDCRNRVRPSRHQGSFISSGKTGWIVGGAGDDGGAIRPVSGADSGSMPFRQSRHTHASPP